MHAPVLNVVNVHIKFEVPSFTHSKYMIKPPKFQMDHVTRTMPPSGSFVIPRLRLTMTNLHAKFEVNEL